MDDDGRTDDINNMHAVKHDCCLQKATQITSTCRLCVPVTKLNVALKPCRAAAVAADAEGMRDIRVTCKLPEAALINIGGCLSAQ